MEQNGWTNNVRIKGVLQRAKDERSRGKVHPCTGTEALYRLYGP